MTSPHGLTAVVYSSVCIHSDVYLGERDKGIDDIVLPSAPAITVPIIGSEGGKAQL